MSAPPPETETTSRRVSPRQVGGALVLVLMLVFVFENTARVEIRLLVPQVRLPLYMALLFAAVLGSIGTILIRWRRNTKE